VDIAAEIDPHLGANAVFDWINGHEGFECVKIEDPSEHFVTPEALRAQIPQHITANRRCHHPRRGFI
jgi:hypothetical protein